jgi:hypothetical protein
MKAASFYLQSMNQISKMHLKKNKKLKKNKRKNRLENRGKKN